MEGVFVTGTDTSVGKTIVSAGLLRLLYGNRPVAYWKPVQTGTIMGDDTEEVRALTELSETTFWDPGYRFPDPVAPYVAAKKWKKEIDLDHLVSRYKSHHASQFMIVEGAGGLLVPLHRDHLQHELIKRLELPVVIVAINQLGTINQTLLTIDACRAKGLEIKGVILTKTDGVSGQGNAECISHYGNVPILAELQKSSEPHAVIAEIASHTGIRSLFNLPPLP